MHFSIIGYISEASTPSTNHELNSNSCDENCQSYLEDPFPPSMCQSLMSEYKHVQGNENSKAKYHRDKEASTPYQMKVWQYRPRPQNFLNILHDFKLLIRIVVKLYVLGFQIPKDEVLLEHEDTKGDANCTLNDKIHPISDKGIFEFFTPHWNINTFKNFDHWN